METSWAVFLTQLPGLTLDSHCLVSPGSQRTRHGAIHTAQGRHTESGPTPGPEEAVGFFPRTTRELSVAPSFQKLKQLP